jgi:hypothetical protein
MPNFFHSHSVYPHLYPRRAHLTRHRAAVKEKMIRRRPRYKEKTIHFVSSGGKLHTNTSWALTWVRFQEDVLTFLFEIVLLQKILVTAVW